MNETTLKIDFRIISVVLLLVIAGMVAGWRPWVGSSEQTITTVGEAKVKAAPNQFVFSPSYQKEGSSSAEAITEVSKIGNEVVTKLRELGVEEKSIKTSVSANPSYDRFGQQSDRYAGYFSVTAIVYDKDQAQKVLDYLVTTSPVYSVSPQNTFTDERRTELETEARAKAVADAKQKAQQTATELEVKVGRVVSVSEPQWRGPILPYASDGKAVSIAEDQASSPILLTGEEEITYSISVVFRLR